MPVKKESGEHLLIFAWSLPHSCVLPYRAGLVQLSLPHVVDERQVVLRVPVQAVRQHVERDRLDHLVDGRDNLERKKRGKGHVVS